MKRIPSTYWTENYLNPPTDLQKAWVQRWLELLDANTSYVHGLSGVTVIGILDELTAITEQVSIKEISKNLRTIFFLLTDLVDYLNKDAVLLGTPIQIPYLQSIADIDVDSDLFSIGIHLSSGWNHLQSLPLILPQLLGGLRLLYDVTGCEEKSQTYNKQRIAEAIASSVVVFRRALDWLRTDNRYRHILCDSLEWKLRESESIHFPNINTLSRNLIVDLIIEANYSASYLSEYCVEVFLKPGSKENFKDRLDVFLSKFRQPKQQFSVYMRVQARRSFRDNQHIGEIAFRYSVPELIPKIEAKRNRDGWSAKDEKQAKDFFFNGQPSNNLIFAILTDISIEDSGNAANLALDKLDIALQQAKFEYELKGFSIDKRMYVYNSTQNTFAFFNTKQLHSARTGSIGDLQRFERVTTWLSAINMTLKKMQSKKDEDDTSVERAIITNVTNTALAWHREAIETNNTKSRFLGHWIGLEQIFEPIETEIGGRKSSADKAVLAIGKLLEKQSLTQWDLDLWGDIHRLDIFGPPRTIALHDGQIRYSEALLEAIVQKGDCTFVPAHEYSRPELLLYYQGQCQKLYVRPGSLILVKDGEQIFSGDWLTAAYWNDSLAQTNGINKLFEGRIPKVENLLFLGFILNHINVPINVEEYVKLLHPLAARLKGNTDKGVDKQKVRALINAMRWYDNIEQTILDFGKFDNDLWQFIDSKEIRDEIQIDRRPYPYPSFVFKFLTYLPQSLLNHSKANGQLTGIIKRLISIAKNTPKHLVYFEFYQELRVQGRNLMQHSEKLPDIVLFELFRGQTPSSEMMKHVFQKGKIQLKTDQHLLSFRLGEKPADDIDLLHFISEVDRMRRTRNMIVHSAQIPNNLGLLTSTLHKYTKIYLREVLYQMAHYPGCSAEQLLLLKD